MTLPRSISPGAGAFVCIWLVLLAGGRSGMLRDPGTFWHTRTGEIILHDGFIRADPYTFTFGGAWWVPYQWLGEVAMALLHRLGGFDAQLLTAVTLLAAVFAWLFVRLLRTGLNFAVAAAVVALGLAAAGSHFHVRPHLFTLTALAITAALLVKCERRLPSPSGRGAGGEGLLPAGDVSQEPSPPAPLPEGEGGKKNASVRKIDTPFLPSPSGGGAGARGEGLMLAGDASQEPSTPAPLAEGKGRGNPLPLTRLFWLIPLFVIWTNVHGGLLGGVATLVIAASGWIIFWRQGFSSPVSSWRDAGMLGLVVLGCGLSVLVNPYGTDMVKTWRIIMDEPLLKQIIIEHRPLDPAKPYAWPIFGLAAVYVFVLAGIHWREIRVTWLLPIVWLLETIDRCRHASLFVVVTLVVLPAMWPATHWAMRLAQTRRDYYDPDAPPLPRPWWANVWLPALVVSISLALIVCRVPVPVIGAGWARHDPKQWPVELLDVIHENEPRPGEPNHLFTDYLGGGFAIYHAPGYKVFVDDRCEVFGGHWLLDFVKATNQDTPQAIAKWEGEFGHFDYALTTTETGFDDYFRTSAEWKCLKRTETAAFYKRK